jgi:hypothetical protein
VKDERRSIKRAKKTLLKGIKREVINRKSRKHKNHTKNNIKGKKKTVISRKITKHDPLPHAPIQPRAEPQSSTVHLSMAH